MLGDQLPRRRVIPAIEVSPNGLPVAEIPKSDRGEGRARKKSASRAYSNKWDRLFCYEGPKPRVCSIFFKWLGLRERGMK